MERVIRKYKNRKMYDTSTSKYVKLTDLLNFTIQGENFKVIDVSQKNKFRDVTCEMLLKASYVSGDINHKNFVNDLMTVIIKNINIDKINNLA